MVINLHFKHCDSRICVRPERHCSYKLLTRDTLSPLLLKYVASRGRVSYMCTRTRVRAHLLVLSRDNLRPALFSVLSFKRAVPGEGEGGGGSIGGGQTPTAVRHVDRPPARAPRVYLS
jgi:hypothetical protein